MTRLNMVRGIAVAAAACALPLTAVPGSAEVNGPFKNSYIGTFTSQQACEADRATNTFPGDPDSVTFPCFFATSSAQLSFAPSDYHGPGWYYRVRTNLA